MPARSGATRDRTRSLIGTGHETDQFSAALALTTQAPLAQHPGTAPRPPGMVRSEAAGGPF